MRRDITINMIIDPAIKNSPGRPTSSANPVSGSSEGVGDGTRVLVGTSVDSVVGRGVEVAGCVGIVVKVGLAVCVGACTKAALVAARAVCVALAFS